MVLNISSSHLLPRLLLADLAHVLQLGSRRDVAPEGHDLADGVLHLGFGRFRSRGTEYVVNLV